MDFLEGALLGPLWSDTDYQNQKHRLSATIYVGIVYSVLLYLLTQPKIPFYLKGMSSFFWLGVTIFFMIISTFICSKYYKLKLWGRFNILFLLFVKYALATVFLISLFSPLYELNVSELKGQFLELLNTTAGNFVSVSAEKFHVMGLILSGSLTAFLGFLAGIIFVIILFYLPIWYLKLVRFFQNKMDYLMQRKDSVF